MPTLQKIRKSHREHSRPPFECIALLLQGGGALGAYQGGVYEALAEADIHPDWVAGISIGAINAALIAGNPAKERVSKLRQFWEIVSSNMLFAGLGDYEKHMANGDISHGMLNQMSATRTVMQGIPGFFTPRFPPPSLQEKGSQAAISYYDTAPLKQTLQKLVDFDRINAGGMTLSLSAVNIKSGNFVYFDTRTHTIGVEHIMASGALPPGLPPVEIDGEYYWDGGLVSNTPLQWVFDSARRDTLAFQVDLWSARGDMPGNMAEVMTRQKEILYSSRTRAATDRFKTSQKIRNITARLLAELPEKLKETPDAKLLMEKCQHKVYSIAHLIYHAQSYEGDWKDYEFSRLSMEEHWKAGYNATVRTLRHPEVLQRPTNHEGVFTFDISNQDE